MYIEDINNMKVITAEEGKLIKDKETGVTFQQMFAPGNIDLDKYEEVYKDKLTEELFKRAEELSSADIDIQMALIELYDIFTLMIGGE